MASLCNVTTPQILTELISRRIISNSDWLRRLIGDILECADSNFGEYLSKVKFMAAAASPREIAEWLSSHWTTATDIIASKWHPCKSGEENIMNAYRDCVAQLACVVWDIAREL